MYRLIFPILFLLPSLQLFPQALINEFSSSNFNGITDEDGDHSDWIEFYNPSTQEASITGYHLSDDPHNLKKWTFPAINLKPGAFLLVFASDKNRTLLPLSYQTVIHKGDEWDYLVPLSEIGNSWKFAGFDASGWNTGVSGFGYGDNDDETVLLDIHSVYIRKEFVITSLQDVLNVVLSIDFDDGFVAYINGHEICRSNLGAAGTTVTYNQSATSREATMYGGGDPTDFHISDPSVFLVEGVNVLAIQGHNTGTGSTDFSLIPMLSLGLGGAGYLDDLPEYLHLKGTKLHANFKIASEGEALFFSSPDSSVIDSLSPVELVADVSFGRKPDGEDNWLFFASPTPGLSNINDGFNTLPRGDTVRFSVEGGYIPGGFFLELSSADPADTIFYTLDGSRPSRNDSIYTNPLQISENCVVRAVSLNIHKLPGVISTNTYITTDHTLPVFCISTDPANLWDFNTGIYVMGPYASTTNPYYGANFWMDWEKEAHMEFFDQNNVRQLNQDIGIKIYGAWSRAHAQKSLALFARREYGKGSFDYKFFRDKAITKFESIILRNGGNDWDFAIFRDGLTSTLIRDMDIDRLAFQPAILYLNGEYWGILNIREKINPDYIAENHFVNPDYINLLENNGNVVDGSNTSYKQLTDFVNSNSLVSEQNYRQVSNKIDVNNFIQYQLTQIYIDNKDWPGNNIKFWNTNEPGSLWRWIIYDTDFGFSIYNRTAYEYNTLAFAVAADGPDYPNPPWATLFLRKMLSNPAFRNNFVNQYADRINTTFKSDRVLANVDSIKGLYNNEINQHIDRWGHNYNSYLSSIDNIKNFATNRPGYARNHLKSVLGLGEMLTIKIEIRNIGTGRVRVNTVIPDKYPFTGIYFKGIPVILTAIPAPGYKFIRWEMGSFISTERIINYNMEAGAIFRAIFEIAESSDNKIVINEINYNSSPERDTKDWVELFNAGNTTVNLKNWVIGDSGQETGFTIATDIVLAPGTFSVICRNEEDFLKIFPATRNTTGDMDFGLNSSGDDINIYDPTGNLIDFVNYTDNSPWPAGANGTGATIELIHPFKDNNLGQNWRIKYNGGSPGENNLITGIGDNVYNSGLGITLNCFPNPFKDFTSVYIEIDKPGKYQLQVYDMQGRLLRVLADQVFEQRSYTIDWDGRDSAGGSVKGGVYIIRLSGTNLDRNIKIVRLEM